MANARSTARSPAPLAPRARSRSPSNGQTHPATLDVTFDGAAVDPLRGGQTVLGFSAHGQIDRSQWGVTEWSAFTGNEVQIVIESEFVKAS
jgi:polyisoprenoid-binding protein YceI